MYLVYLDTLFATLKITVFCDKGSGSLTPRVSKIHVEGIQPLQLFHEHQSCYYSGYKNDDRASSVVHLNKSYITGWVQASHKLSMEYTATAYYSASKLKFCSKSILYSYIYHPYFSAIVVSLHVVIYLMSFITCLITSFLVSTSCFKEKSNHLYSVQQDSNSSHQLRN